MWYVIFAEDVSNSLPLRKQNRPAHIARIEALQAQGRVLVAGPTPAIDSETPDEAGFSGSVMIVEFDSLPHAQAWADDDPYVRNGVYASVVVKPFKNVIPM